jgi:endo-1,4-beta-xylanase
MKRNTIALCLIAGVSLLAFSCQSTEPAKTETKAAKATVAPAATPAPAAATGKVANVKKAAITVDGTMEDAWKAADVLKTEAVAMGDGKSAYAEFRVLWDENFLYVLADVKDAKLSDSNSNAWEQDSIEIVIDQNNGKTAKYQADDGQYRISFKNKVSSGGAADTAKLKSATAVTATGYIVEAAIPFTKIAAAAGTKIGFDLQVNDDSGKGARTGIKCWSDTTNNNYQSTVNFGTLTLQ